MKVALIVAMDEQQGIGKNNDLMWHLPADMRFFKETTMGHIVVMGRKNYESIPGRFRPLPNRENVILSRSHSFQAEDCKTFSSIESCLKNYADESERTLFIIGGGEIYSAALETGKVEELFITHVHHTYEADTFFPEINWEEWDSTSLFTQLPDEKHAVGFTVKHYLRKKTA